MIGRRKESLHRLVFLTFLCILLCFLSGCSQGVMFSGSTTCNDDQFLLDFEMLNTTVDGEMQLSHGDQIQSTIQIEEGKLDVLVKKESGEIAYQWNDVASCEFRIHINEMGRYTFSVSGKKAVGRVLFIKAQTPSDARENKGVADE